MWTRNPAVGSNLIRNAVFIIQLIRRLPSRFHLLAMSFSEVVRCARGSPSVIERHLGWVIPK